MHCVQQVSSLDSWATTQIITNAIQTKESGYSSLQEKKPESSSAVVADQINDPHTIFVHDADLALHSWSEI